MKYAHIYVVYINLFSILSHSSLYVTECLARKLTFLVLKSIVCMTPERKAADEIIIAIFSQFWGEETERACNNE